MRCVAVTMLFAACGMNPPPRQTEFPTLALSDTYNTRMADLRTTLGRAGISLRVAGASDSFSTPGCDDETEAEYCVRCELASESTRVDGALIEAATAVFRQYPAEVLSAHKVDHVAMCNEIVYEKPGETEHPAGLADPASRGMLISVSYFLDRAYTRGAEFNVADIIHHELYHLLEYQFMRADMRTDVEWRLYNPLGFEYDPAAKVEGVRREGFVNAYAMTSAVEDKASVYEFLMAHPEDLCEMARTDETLRIKTRIIWRRVVKAVGTDTFMRAAAPCVGWLET